MQKICRFAVVFLFLAAFLSSSTTGSRLVLLQSVAWGTMFTNYSRHFAWREAARRTFDGKHPCGICRRIQQEREVAGVSVLLSGHESAPLVRQEFVFQETVSTYSFFLSSLLWFDLSHSPPIPPPRFA